MSGESYTRALNFNSADDFSIFPEPSGDCANCHQRPATERWTSEGGTLALVHGGIEFWCKPCCLQAQLDYARERAAAIPELERELAAFGGKP
jgi:hypothetical protein